MPQMRQPSDGDCNDQNRPQTPAMLQKRLGPRDEKVHGLHIREMVCRRTGEAR